MAIESIARHYTWLLLLIPALPALAAVIGLTFGGLGLGRRTAAVTIGAMAVVAAIAWGAVLLPVLVDWRAAGGHGAFYFSHDWILFRGGTAPVVIGVMVDHLTAAMLAMVSLLVLLIEIYAVGYMASDAHFSRFHSYVSLFAAGMLGLVVSNNFLTLLVSWEIMGLCSYLLIGFWFERDSARKAAKKAFMVTRVGDMGLLAALMILFWGSGSFSFDVVFAWAKVAPALLVVLAALCLFAASVGKSAQFPLHVWLPDAMEGPTPVSALIHAATMVSAGVYLVARSYPLFYGTDGALEAVIGPFVVRPLAVVAWVGGFTALFAATIALVQTDIKKVLAYSTVSQLGYMFLGLGVGGYTAACFHLLTHAFFKALLFLGSGSVIHAVEHGFHHVHLHEDPQDMRHMGALAKKLPTTHATFLVGVLALAGIFPFSGFFSKDEIVLEVLLGHHANQVLAGFALVAAFLTALYSTRMMILTFYGQPRHREAWEATHESPRVMTWPLVVIAVFAALLGLPALPSLLAAAGLGHGHNLFHAFINLGALSGYGVLEPAALAPSIALALVATAIALVGVALGWWLWASPSGMRLRSRLAVSQPVRAVLSAPRALYWVNEFWWWILVRPLLAAARACNGLDRWVIDLTVNAVGWLALQFSAVGRLFDGRIVDGAVLAVGRGSWNAAELGKFAQDGRVQNYAVFSLVGLLVVLMLVLRWWGGL